MAGGEGGGRYRPAPPTGPRLGIGGRYFWPVAGRFCFGPPTQRSAAPRRAALLSPCPQLPLLTALFSLPPPNPLPFSSLEAKHVNKKATKKHQDRRPKKSRPSDINRKPVEYPDAGTAPPEYTISDAPAVVAKKPE